MTCSSVNYLVTNCYRTARKFSGLHGKSADCRESQRAAGKINGQQGKTADCKKKQRTAGKVSGWHGKLGNCTEKSADCTESQQTARHCTAMTEIFKLLEVKY
jgi:hypothetical protein